MRVALFLSAAQHPEGVPGESDSGDCPLKHHITIVSDGKVAS